MAETLGIPNVQNATITQLRSEVHGYLAAFGHKKPFLLIFDRSTPDLELPTGGHGSVLVLSEKISATGIQMEPFSKKEGVELVKECLEMIFQIRMLKI